MFCRPSRLLTVGTTLHKSEVIFGGEENLRQQIINVYHQYNPKIILVISTCVPQLIGEDVSGVLTELREELPDLKLAYCQTGFNHHFATPRGSDVSWTAVIEVLDPQDKVENSVGLMGRAGQDADSLGVFDLFHPGSRDYHLCVSRRSSGRNGQDRKSGISLSDSAGSLSDLQGASKSV